MVYMGANLFREKKKEEEDFDYGKMSQQNIKSSSGMLIDVCNQLFLLYYS